MRIAQLIESLRWCGAEVNPRGNMVYSYYYVPGLRYDIDFAPDCRPHWTWYTTAMDSRQFGVWVNCHDRLILCLEAGACWRLIECGDWASFVKEMGSLDVSYGESESNPQDRAAFLVPYTETAPPQENTNDG